MKKFTIKKIKSTPLPEKNEDTISKKDLAELYDGEENNHFKHPITHSRVVVITLVVGVVFGFLAGLVGVIFFFSGSFSFLKISPEDLLPAQQFKIERHEQVNVLEDERLAKISQNSQKAVVSVFRKKPLSENVLENVYLPSESRGAGFVLTADGWIMTHSQAISDTALDYVVIASDKQILDVKKFVFDDFSAVVFLKVEAENLNTLPISNSFDLQSGERLMVFNNLADLKTQSLLVRLEKRDWQDNSARSKLIKQTTQADNFLSFTQLVDEKYLGSPIINMSGEVVGAVIKQGEKVVGRLVQDFKSAINQILEGKNKIERVILGVRYLDLSSAVGANIKVRQGNNVLLLDKGVLLVEVIVGTPAAEAKLIKGDVIIKVGDKEVNAVNNFGRLLQEYSLGDSTNLTVLRQGSEEEMLVTVNF